MQEAQVWSLGWEDCLEKEMATHPLQYCYLENPMDRGTSQATVHGVAKSWTLLSDWTLMHEGFARTQYFGFKLELGLYAWIERINIVKMFIELKTIYRFSVTPIKNPVVFLTEI